MGLTINSTKIINIGNSGYGCGYMPYTPLTPGCFNYGFNSYMPMYPPPFMCGNAQYIGVMGSFIGFNFGKSLANLIFH